MGHKNDDPKPEDGGSRFPDRSGDPPKPTEPAPAPAPPEAPPEPAPTE